MCDAFLSQSDGIKFLSCTLSLHVCNFFAFIVLYNLKYLWYMPMCQKYASWEWICNYITKCNISCNNLSLPIHVRQPSVIKKALWYTFVTDRTFQLYPVTSITPWAFALTHLPWQNGHHFTDDIMKCISLNEIVWMSIKISLKFVPKGAIYNIPALVPIMAVCRPAEKPLSEPMLIQFTNAFMQH